MKIPTYIVGAGGLGKGVLETVTMICNKNRNWEVKGFIDDNFELHQMSLLGVPVLGGVEYLLEIDSFSNVILAIANPHVKSIVYEMLSENKNLFFPNIIHPNVQLSNSTIIGWGNIISENVSFSSNVIIGNFILIHFNSSIGHDVEISNYSTIYPGANISGHVKLMEKCEVGSNACILPSYLIGEGASIGAGALVNKNVEENTIVAGVPIKSIRITK